MTIWFSAFVQAQIFGSGVPSGRRDAVPINRNVLERFGYAQCPEGHCE